MRIYVASSWRNEIQPEIVSELRLIGHQVYDFRNPEPGDSGFHWSDIDPDWQRWERRHFKAALNNPIAESGFEKDLRAMKWAEAFVLVMPCGRSAHLELGWAVGAGKKTFILLSDGEPELMYKLADFVCADIEELIYYLGEGK